MDRWFTAAHRFQILFGWNPSIHNPNPLRLAILLLYLFEKGRERRLVTGVAWHHFVTQGKPLGSDDQSNHHLNAIRTLEIGRHTSELQSHHDLVCRLLLEKKKTKKKQ